MLRSLKSIMLLTLMLTTQMAFEIQISDPPLKSLESLATQFAASTKATRYNTKTA